MKKAKVIERPIVYIASPYTKGDPAINTHFQCSIFNQLMNDGKVWPVAPLWAHFQHTLFPRRYQDWVDYDLALLRLYDACLRVNPCFPEWSYNETESLGADGEIAYFKSAKKPIFYSIGDLYKWVDGR